MVGIKQNEFQKHNQNRHITSAYGGESGRLTTVRARSYAIAKAVQTLRIFQSGTPICSPPSGFVRGKPCFIWGLNWGPAARRGRGTDLYD